MEKFRVNEISPSDIGTENLIELHYYLSDQDTYSREVANELQRRGVSLALSSENSIEDNGMSFRDFLDCAM